MSEPIIMVLTFYSSMTSLFQTLFTLRYTSNIILFNLLCIGLTITSCNSNDSPSEETFKLTSIEKAWIANHPIIRLVPYPDYPPAEFIDSLGNYSGIAADYITIITKMTGLQIKLVESRDWPTTLLHLSEKKIDLIALASKRPDRQKYALFSEPYLNFPMVIITKNIVKRKIRPVQLAGKTVAVVKGYAAEKYLRINYPRLQTRSVSSVTEGLRKVSFGEIYALVSDLSSASYYINKEAINNLKVSGELEYQYQLSFAIRNDWPILQTIINKSLKTISKKTKQSIFQKWVPIYTEPTIFTNTFLIALATFLIILLILFIFYYQRNKHLATQLVATELKQKLAEVSQKQAEENSLNKSNFLSNMSHELRTPLNAILGYTELIDTTKMEPSSSGYLKNIRESSELLLTLIDGILDISKIEAGQLSLNYNPCQLNQILSLTKDATEILIEKSNKNIKFEMISMNIPDQSWLLDEIRLLQILNNLISNAVKFTNKGLITIEAKIIEIESINELHFTIQDTGIGIPVEKQGSVFSSFNQVDTNSNRSFDGAGIGLSITKNIINIMGGQITLESKTSKVSGTKIFFIIPLKKSAPLMDSNKVKPNPQTNTFDRTILLVEDNEMNALLASTILKKQGFNIILAGNGKIALTKLQNHLEIDLVLMDMRMPVMAGLETTQKIRINEKNNNSSYLPIIALSANAMKSDQDEALEAGCNEYLTKPINASLLIKTVNKYLQK